MVGSRVEQLSFAFNLRVEVGGLACRKKARGMNGDSPISSVQAPRRKALPKVVKNITPSTSNSCRLDTKPPTSK
ncbi:hypothetical protein K443DRAFT_217624 [Laccaria amethystina LaAM-08-1]|uniref:Uncharacterized protein n=1 Tax=Laccaria amethystina LaAM-08-1 TaxID=1095629 RepID=A0A0C9X4P5_9AGAR|nr:hypothetical protein K443DRAFT_217624 [Laccaria amethystina LaAM-08-1]